MTTGCIEMPEIPAFSHLSLSASRTFLTPKMCGFLSVWRFLLFFCLTVGSRCLQDVWCPAIWPVSPPPRSNNMTVSVLEAGF